MSYLLDTSTISLWARKASAPLMVRMRSASPSALCVASLVEFELRYGLGLNPEAKSRAPIESLLSVVACVPFNDEAARHAARIRVALTRAGTPIGGYDLLIAATALAHDKTIVTDNVREFARVEGLRVENWAHA
jgi:tRNA(fMet)-specific endonuclease VapC